MSIGWPVVAILLAVVFWNWVQGTERQQRVAATAGPCSLASLVLIGALREY